MKTEILKKRLWPAMLFLVMTLVAAVSGILVPGTASALSNVDFSVSNVDLGVVGPYGKVTWDVSGNIATFKVDAYEGILNVNNATNFGIDKFFFNTSLDTDSFTINVPTNWDIIKDKNADGFGKFMILLSDPPRMDPLEFTISGLPDTVTDDDFFVFSDTGAGPAHFAMHVGDFSPALNSQTSAFFRDGGPSIPDPATIFLLGSASLIGFAGARRKFKK